MQDELVSDGAFLERMRSDPAFTRETEARSLRQSLVRLGTRRIGAPTVEVSNQLAALTDPTRLQVLLERVLETVTWTERLAD
jgi:hypothetical protein